MYGSDAHKTSVASSPAASVPASAVVGALVGLAGSSGKHDPSHPAHECSPLTPTGTPAPGAPCGARQTEAAHAVQVCCRNDAAMSRAAVPSASTPRASAVLQV
ncbi:hypothetical protein ACF09C_06005 [Streptomyces sp. NPDC014870]|uniref:hypothetical protein n=1 Tax=Streptomyces sp. NPDC014870 TaxID=3364925 RepID=UPI0036F64923